MIFKKMVVYCKNRMKHTLNEKMTFCQTSSGDFGNRVVPLA
jgi:hypothetical protein